MIVPAALTLPALRAAYAAGTLSPVEVMAAVDARAGDPRHPHVWIERFTRAALEERAAALPPRPTPELPLYGIPFAIKDNIDLAGLPTTVACPDFAFRPPESATVVHRLIAAGAIPIGKTNLDQFATGLVGTRSPYGAGTSVFNPAYISGGSSAGSAVAVAAGMASFSLGTDTAGSGRVPAAFGNIVGHKPTRGLLSNRGVFPACRSLDCISIFAGTCHDAREVLRVAAAYDAEDAYSRAAPAAPRLLPEKFRFGVLPAAQREFFGDSEAAALYDEAIARLQTCGGRPVEIDYTPFAEAAALLYAGPWVAERRWALGDFFDSQPGGMDATVRGIIAGAAKYDAVAAFDAQYRLQACIRRAEAAWREMDVLLLPTTGTTFTLEAVRAEPVLRNSELGQYTNFVNLLDLAALAVPAGFRRDGEKRGLPFGVTLVGPAFSDEALLELGARFHRCLGGEIGATACPVEAEPLVKAPAGAIQLAVVGAHLQGQPLNHQLTSRGARLAKATRTSPRYRLYALAGTQPPKPGLRRVEEVLDAGIAVEVWSLDEAAFGAFTAEVPTPLGIGSIELEDGSWVKGFICEPWALESARDITTFGGWLAFRAQS